MELVQAFRSLAGRCPGSSEPGLQQVRFFGTGFAAGLEIPECQGGLGLVEFGFSGHKGRDRVTGSTSDQWIMLQNGGKPMRASAVANPGLPQYGSLQRARPWSCGAS